MPQHFFREFTNQILRRLIVKIASLTGMIFLGAYLL